MLHRDVAVYAAPAARRLAMEALTVEASTSAGENTASWSVTQSERKRIVPGVYVARLNSDGVVRSRTFVVR